MVDEGIIIVEEIAPASDEVKAMEETAVELTAVELTAVELTAVDEGG